MVRNIVFDLGNVLIDYNPRRIIASVFPNQEEQELILKEVFQSKGWKQLDRGVLSFEEHHKNIAEKLPQFEREIEWILNNWHKDQPSVEGMYAVVKKLRSYEFDLYVLSNASERFYNFALANNPILKFFKGITISAELKLLKPEREIYDQFCEIHNLTPDECLFIDDQLVNVQAAADAGWQAYQFTGTSDLIPFLEEKLGITFNTNNLSKSQ